MPVGRPPSVLAPWAGMVSAALGALLQHAGLGDALHLACGSDARLAEVGTSLAALALMGIGGWISWRAARHAGDDGDDTPRFVAQLSLMAVALFALLVLWRLATGSGVPVCAP